MSVTVVTQGTDNSSARVDAPRGAARFPYHASLDGLRALALVAIVAYHLGYRWAHGGTVLEADSREGREAMLGRMDDVLARLTLVELAA